MALYKAIVDIAYTETPVPAGQTVGANSEVMVTLTGPAGVVNPGVVVPNSTASYTFEHLVAGDYSVEVKQLDDSGVLVGAPVSFPFTVIDTVVPATFMAPSGVNVTVQPE